MGSDLGSEAAREGVASVIEYEFDAQGNRTGRTRRRQFTIDYARAARSGVWPMLELRAAWCIPFR